MDQSQRPYFDDYKKEKGFYKILFKPGLSLQAREINQLQEILQQQIARLGSHIFKNGSVVIPGNLKLNRDVQYVILTDVDNDPELQDKLKGKKLVQDIDGSNLEAAVLYTQRLTGTLVLAVVNYLNSATKVESGNIVNVTRFLNTYSIAVDGNASIHIAVATQGPNGEPNTGKATLFTVESGVFFVDNYFVYNDTQTVLMGWNYDKLNAKAGFVVRKEIVTAYDDPSLFDNAVGSPNEGAPGADRFAIYLDLTALDLNDDIPNFIELVRIEDNRLRTLKQYSQYNALEDTLARRTYDESGDYVVRGFDIKVLDHLKDERNPAGFRTAQDGGNDNLIAVEVSAGKAYVKGYEVENLSSFYLEAKKPREQDSTRSANEVIQVNQVGEYIYLAPGNQFFDISRHPIIWLTNGQESTASIIGYCIPKHLEAFNISGRTIFKLYGSFFLAESAIYGWQHLGGWKIDNIKNGPVLQKITLENVVSNFNVSDGQPLTSHVGYTPYAWDSANKILYVKKTQTAPPFNTQIQVTKGSASGYVSLIEFKQTHPLGGGDLIPFSISYIKTTRDALGNIELTADVGFTVTIPTNASGYGHYDYLGDGVFVGQPVAADTTRDDAYFNNIVSIENDGKRLVINNAAHPNTLFAVSASLRKNLAVKTKSLVEGSTVIANPSSRLMALAHKDIYRLKHVYVSANTSTPATTSDPDIVDYFELVNNDTLDFYQNTLLKIKQGFGVPAGQLLVVYDYFLHGTGDVFTVDSYAVLKDNPGDIHDVTHIGRIPIFRTKEKAYFLSDYLDFRQTPRDGFFILRGTVTNGSPDILLDHDYSNVIAVGSKIYSNGFTSGTTVSAVDAQKIVASANSSYTGTVYVVVNVSSAAETNEPFYPREKHIWAPISGQAIIYDATYFVERWDRVVCFKNGEIKYLYGIPGVTKFPDTPTDAMSLATLILPPYTRSAAFVKYKKDDNRRYTMRDIGKLETRIENLEYYTSLTLKELETRDLKITDVNGLDRFKSGFFVSDFKDFGVFSPFNGQFGATLVSELNRVIPLEYSDSINLVLNQSQSSNFTIKGNKIFLPYTEVVEIEQPYATASETVNPYLIIQWNPALILDPAEDHWIETEWAPTVTNVTELSRTITNENTVVNERTNTVWSTRAIALNFFGWQREAESIERTRVLGTREEVASVTTSTSVTRTSEVTRSTRLLGVSLIPFIRSRTIRFDLKASKPRTRYWAVFDSTDVNALCRPISGNWGDPLISDNMGNLVGEFHIPPATFTTGTKTFMLADIDILRYPDAGIECLASASYTAIGQLRTMQEVIDIVNTTTTTINRTITINRITTIEETEIVLVDPTGGGDPLAQSFFMTDINASGAFITKIDLFFRKKDPFAPVFIELREMINGYPVNHRIPGSLVVLRPNQVNVSEDSSVATSFVFDEPIWLQARKEYCFVVGSPSSRYHVWIARLGEKVVNEERVIGEQPSLGSLFKSQNATTWTPFQLEDIKFRIYRAKFNDAVAANLIFENDGKAARRRVQLSGFYTQSGSKFITIRHENHGMNVNEIVKIEAEQSIGMTNNSPASSESFNGIPMSEIYGTHIVKDVVDINHYKIEVTTSANKTGYFQDVKRYVYIYSNINFYMYRLVANEFIPQDGSIRYFSSLITGKDFDGGQTPKVSMPEQQIKNNDMNLLQHVALVQITENETASKSMKIKAVMKSSNNYISPVLHLKENAVIVSSLALNKPENDNETDAVFENGKAASKIITVPIRLKAPSNALRIFTLENKQETDDIEVYYRTAINRDLEERTWIKIDPINTMVTYDNETFIEHERQVEGIPEFDEFQIKIVFKGKNSIRRPALGELRAIAIAD